MTKNQIIDSLYEKFRNAIKSGDDSHSVFVDLSRNEMEFLLECLHTKKASMQNFDERIQL